MEREHVALAELGVLEELSHVHSYPVLLPVLVGLVDVVAVLVRLKVSEVLYVPGIVESKGTRHLRVKFRNGYLVYIRSDHIVHRSASREEGNESRPLCSFRSEGFRILPSVVGEVNLYGILQPDRVGQDVADLLPCGRISNVVIRSFGNKVFPSVFVPSGLVVELHSS